MERGTHFVNVLVSAPDVGIIEKMRKMLIDMNIPPSNAFQFFAMTVIISMPPIRTPMAERVPEIPIP